MSPVLAYVLFLDEGSAHIPSRIGLDGISRGDRGNHQRLLLKGARGRAMAFFIGALVSSYLVLRGGLYFFRKFRKQPNGSPQIAMMGVIALGIATIIGGFGFQDEAPEPLFVTAFSLYFGPVIIVTIFEIVRYKIKVRR